MEILKIGESMGLNRAQGMAAAHKDGPCLVLAGPGSGKTLTIARRIEYLIVKYKVRPEEILVITFTKTRNTGNLRNLSRDLLWYPEMGI